MAYRHGVYIEEQATGLVTPVEVESALPVVVGTAPVHNLPEGTQAPVNEPKLYYSMPEFVAGMGGLKEGESPSDYTLYEMASLYFERYKVKPLVAINVFDPAKHTSPLEGEEGRTKPDVGKVSKEDIIGGIDGDLRRTGLALAEETFPRFRLVPGQILAPGFSGDPAVGKAIGAACKDICGHFRALHDVLSSLSLI